MLTYSENWAAPHTIKYPKILLENDYPYNRMHGPSSTLHSNVLDMCNWAMINMNQGIYKDKKILNSSSYEILWKPWFKINEETHVGLSWFLSKYKNKEVIMHEGRDIGFQTSFIMVPEESIAVVILCNTTMAPLKKIESTALDLILCFELES